MSNETLNPWKLATIGILLVGASVAATMLVVGRDSKTESTVDSQTAQISETQSPGTDGKAALAREAAPIGRERTTRSPSPSRAAYPAQSAYPLQSAMEECNKYANDEVDSKAEEVLKNAALGAAIGAAVGAAGGAIAGGGSGAGKGAAIGGVAGAAGGSLYGLNETKSHDAQYRAAYSSCMRSKGH